MTRAALGPLTPVVTPDVTDVLVNGPGQVWVDGRGGLRRVAVTALDTEAQVRQLAQRLAAAGGRRLDDACPYADVRLPGGIRVHAVLEALCRGGTHVSLRVPRPVPPRLADLADQGGLDPGTADVLAGAAAAGEGIVVSGLTGSGKTTLLAAALAHVPGDRRIVVVEDAAELSVAHPHVVHLEARQPNVEGAGGVGLDVLVRQALRMRPDHLVVGEVRGPEVRDLVSALSTGHAGATTVHAAAPDAVPDRIGQLAEASGMDAAAAVRRFRAAMGLLVHVQRDESGRRQVAGAWGWGAGARLHRRDGRG
ncbi:MAG: CpaF family protein [Kineosporiaceae bacterium]